MNRTLASIAAFVSIVVILMASQYPRYRNADGDSLPLRRMLIAGSGAPVVVFENGLGPPLSYWQRVQTAVSSVTTTLSYDRAGITGPDAPEPRDALQIARELHTALRNAQVPPPYVLVGHSIGGLYVRVFASLYPDEVAALVLVDPSRHDEIDAESVANSTYPELHAMPAAQQQARAATLPDIPVYLIMAMGARDDPFVVDDDALLAFAAGRQEDLEAHREWVSGLPNGHLIVTENSGHNVPIEEDELVIDTIRRALEAAL